MSLHTTNLNNKLDLLAKTSMICSTDSIYNKQILLLLQFFPGAIFFTSIPHHASWLADDCHSYLLDPLSTIQVSFEFSSVTVDLSLRTTMQITENTSHDDHCKFLTWLFHTPPRVGLVSLQYFQTNISPGRIINNFCGLLSHTDSNLHLPSIHFTLSFILSILFRCISFCEFKSIFQINKCVMKYQQTWG